LCEVLTGALPLDGICRSLTIVKAVSRCKPHAAQMPQKMK